MASCEITDRKHILFSHPKSNPRQGSRSPFALAPNEGRISKETDDASVNESGIAPIKRRFATHFREAPKGRFAPNGRNMKAKQGVNKEDNTGEDGGSNADSAKRRGRRKPPAASSDKTKDDKAKKVLQAGPKKVVQRRAILIKKNIRTKKALITNKDNVKATARQVPAKNIKKNVKAKKPEIKIEVKTEEIEAPEPGPSEAPESRPSSPKSGTFARRQRLTSDILMMKNAFGDSPTSIIGCGKSPYSTRSERSKSPLVIPTKDNEPPMKLLRNGKQRKAKSSLLTDTVELAFKRRRRLLSDSKDKVDLDSNDEAKKRRVRSFSRDGSEISKCSDFTESDLSFCDSVDTDSKDVKVTKDPNVDNGVTTISELKDIIKTEPLDRSESPKPEEPPKERSASLDSENNNAAKSTKPSNEEGSASNRSLILDNMSKAFNEGPLSKIRRSKRQRKSTVKAKEQEESAQIEKITDAEIKQEDVDENAPEGEETAKVDTCTMSVTQFYSIAKTPVSDEKPDEESSKAAPIVIDDNSKSDDVESLRLQFDDDDEDSDEKTEESSKENIESLFSSKPYSNQDIDKLIDKLRTFEELDRKRQQEMLAKSTPKTPMMVTNDVVLIAKSGAEIKPLKDIQSTVAADVDTVKPAVDKESVLSCFENNSAISIVKKDIVRKSIDKEVSRKSIEKEIVRKSTEKETPRKSIDRKSIEIDLPSSITLIPRGGGSRKPSTSSTPNETLTMLEKTLGKDITLELRKSVEKPIGDAAGSSKTIVKYTPTDVVSVSIPESIAPVLSSEISITIKEVPIVASVDKPSIPVIEKVAIAVIDKIATPTIEKVTASVVEKAATSVKEKFATRAIEKVLSSVIPAPVNEKIPTPVIEKVISPITEKVPILKTEKVAIPVCEKVAVPVSEKVIVPVSEKVAVPISKKVSVPVSEKIAIPVTERVVVPVTEKVAVPVAEKVAVPTVGKITIPTVEKATVSPIEKVTVSTEKAIVSPVEKAVIFPIEKVDVSMEEKAISVTVEKENENKEIPIEIKPIHKEAKPEAPLQSVSKEAINESPENQKRKENILRTLGLLTLKEADEAKIEKLKQKELFASKSSKSSLQKMNSSNDGYTGTLKTVIKLNRGSSEKKKQARSSLKMTFQKSKGRPARHVLEGISGESDSDENPYYTIHKEFGDPSLGGATSSDHGTSGGQRKSHYSNRFNNHDALPGDSLGDVAAESGSGKESSLNLVIPEKASSFSIHPGRLCQDQCFYCGGKFGLFDTPCHVAQIKSTERQKKILDNEEKLTVDSCLCDACYRHVDRRANCPSYRKRLAPAPLPPSLGPASHSPPGPPGSICHAEKCAHPATHSIRRKWLLKMRKTVNRVVSLELDYPGLHTIPLCQDHYQSISRLMVCGLCTRRLTKNHIHFINQEHPTLNPLLEQNGIPVSFEDKTMVCKLCRYFSTLLLKPPVQSQVNKKAFLKSYRKRLLLAHNIQPPEDSESDPAEEPSAPDDKNSKETPSEAAESGAAREKKKSKSGKSKSKKSSESGKQTDENSCESKEGKEKRRSGDKAGQSGLAGLAGLGPGMDEQDIESLISSNKIPVPAAGPASEPSEPSDAELLDFEGPQMPTVDDQSELQYLLQKQNTPSAYLKGAAPNLTHKSKNILKVHNACPTNRTHTQKVLDKNAKRIQKLGQIITHKTDAAPAPPKSAEFAAETTAAGEDRSPRENPDPNVPRNIALNDECTIESIPTKSTKTPDINQLKNKWQMSDSFSQVKKNLNELSKNLSGDQIRKKSDAKFANPVRRLETNPSISVRELFPGEEEMNLHCNFEFNNVKAVTPEGWEKCASTVQYDKDTRNLWQELQRPYGNQSSFLRHLILLEKYFRSGDLILSHNASGGAITYSDSVQNRLRAYDNVPTGRASTSKHAPPKPPQNLNAVTITPQMPTPPEIAAEPGKKTDSLIEFRKQKSASGKSLLKANNNLDKPDLMSMVNQAKLPKNVPMSLAQLTQTIDTSMSMPKMPAVPTNPRPDRPPFPLPSSLTIETKMVPAKADKPRTNSLPPELIAINSQNNSSRKSIENVLKNIQQLAKNAGAASQPIISAAQSPILPPILAPNLASNLAQPVPNPLALFPASPNPPIPLEIDKQKAAVAPKKSKSGSKLWRPTLIPITDESKARNSQDVLYQTADGRRLPSLVQVMSAGRPYHITIQDYNKMCIMRREKLHQLQKAELSKGGPGRRKACEPDGICIPEQPGDAPADAPARANGRPEAESDPTPASILKNVGLKNITIAPVSAASLAENKIKSTPIASSHLSQSLLIATNAAMAQLASSISIATTSAPMPKIPKSLTVIPQSLSESESSIAVSTTMSYPAMSVVSKPATKP